MRKKILWLLSLLTVPFLCFSFPSSSFAETHSGGLFPNTQTRFTLSLKQGEVIYIDFSASGSLATYIQPPNTNFLTPISLPTQYTAGPAGTYFLTVRNPAPNVRGNTSVVFTLTWSDISTYGSYPFYAQPENLPPATPISNPYNFREPYYYYTQQQYSYQYKPYTEVVYISADRRSIEVNIDGKFYWYYLP